MTPRTSAPPYDEDADYYFITSNRGSATRYHRPSPDGDEPACVADGSSVGSGPISWVEIDANHGKISNLSLCKSCRGRRITGGSGPSMRKRLLASDPEDFGLDPMPDSPSGYGARSER